MAAKAEFPCGLTDGGHRRWGGCVVGFFVGFLCNI